MLRDTLTTSTVIFTGAFRRYEPLNMLLKKKIHRKRQGTKESMSSIHPDSSVKLYQPLPELVGKFKVIVEQNKHMKSPLPLWKFKKNMFEGWYLPNSIVKVFENEWVSSQSVPEVNCTNHCQNLRGNRILLPSKSSIVKHFCHNTIVKEKTWGQNNTTKNFLCHKTERPGWTWTEFLNGLNHHDFGNSTIRI